MGKLAEHVRSYLLAPFTTKNYPGDPALRRLFGERATSSGLAVTEENATGIATTWACVNLLAASVGLCVPYLYRRRPDGSRERFDEHRLFPLLAREPNPWQTSIAMRQMATVSLLLRGAAYIQVLEYDQAGRPQALMLRHPDAVQPYFTDAGELRYRLTNARGLQSVIPADEMCAVVSPMSLDGITPVSVLSRAREAFGTALAQDRYAGRFFENSARPSGVLQTPGRLTTEAKEQLRDAWVARYGGVENSSRPAVLEENMTWTSISLSNEDSQLLESRRWSAEEICRLFYNIPPSMVGVATQGSGLTYRNVEDEALRFLTFSLLPILRLFEASYNASLISSLERNQQYIEHDTTALLRTDLQSRYHAYSVGRQWGWLSADDVRTKENMPPLPNGQGQVYLSPSATVSGGVPASAGSNGYRTIIKQVRYNEQGLITEIIERPDGGEPRVTAIRHGGDDSAAPESAGPDVGALRRVVEDACRRLVHREVTRVRRAASAPERLRQYFAEVYLGPAEERDTCSQILEASVGLILHTQQSGLRPHDVARKVVDSHFGRSHAALRQLLTSVPADRLRQRVEEQTETWLVDRTLELTNAVMQGGSPR